MKTLSELFETPQDSPEYWRNPYELHLALKWKPWQPSPADVWASETATKLWANQAIDWPELRRQLQELHTEYLRRKQAT